MILCPTQKNDEIPELLENINIPYVLLGRRPNNIQLQPNYIVWDDFEGGLLATEHLLSLGHKRILCLSGPLYISSACDRLNGYYTAHKNWDVPVDERLVKRLTLVGHDLDKTIREAMECDGGFTGVFAFSDMIAWETIHTLKKMKKKIPDDISVVGFDDIQSKLAFPFGLTTIHTPKTVMAVKLVEVLMKKINKKRKKVVQAVLPVELVIRETTKQVENNFRRNNDEKTFA